MNTASVIATINNYPAYADEYAYIVARQSGIDLWFWGAYSTLEKATAAAHECNGIVFRTE